MHACVKWFEGGVKHAGARVAKVTNVHPSSGRLMPFLSSFARDHFISQRA
jgi:hypothetical protein